MIKYIKNHLSLILPLIVLLFCFEFFIMTNQTIKQYESSMLENYSILISSKKELKDLKTKLPFVKEYTPIDTKDIIDNFKSSLSKDTISEITKSMPYYYNVRLNYFPKDKLEISNIKNSFLSLDNINKVEMFTNKLDSSKKSLIFIKTILNIFILFCSVVTIMLILKQMTIWNLKYNKKIFIMKLFGAGFFFRTSLIYRFAFIDSVIASILTTVGIYWIYSNQKYQIFYEYLNITSKSIDPIDLSIKFLIISIFVSFVIVTLTFGPLYKTNSSKDTL